MELQQVRNRTCSTTLLPHDFGVGDGPVAGGRGPMKSQDDPAPKVTEDKCQGQEVKVRVADPRSGDIPKWELAIYAIYWIGFTSLGLHRLYVFSNEMRASGRYRLGKLIVTGWLSSESGYGTVNEFWISLYKKFPVLISYVIIHRLSVTYLNSKAHHMLCSAISVAYFMWYMGPGALLCALIPWFVHFVLGMLQLEKLGWMVHLAFMISQSYRLESFNWRSWFDDMFCSRNYVCHAYGHDIFTMGGIRCMVMMLALFKKQKPTSKETWINQFFVSLHFFLFVPPLGQGPLILYDSFETQSKTPVSLNWKRMLTRLARLFFCAVIIQVVLKLFYFHIVTSYFMAMAPLAVMLASCYLRGQYFMLEYMQFYGITGILSHIAGVEVEDWPDCISHVYSYKEMWRVFDRGLAVVLKNCIYIPVGGSRAGLFRKILGMLLSFSYVIIFHGIDISNFSWVGLNVFQILLEDFFGFLYKLTAFGVRLRETFSPAMIRRLSAGLATFMVYMSHVAIFCFFVHYDSGKAFAFRVATEDISFTILYALCSYSAVQMAMEYYNYKARVKQCPFSKKSD